jgi:chemotaxis protein histidine kinase CheA
VIVKTLAEAMHGTIAAQSVSGEGSKFTVTLPIAGMVAVPSALPARSLPRQSPFTSGCVA